MEIKRNFISRMPIEDFADMHGLVMEINERRNAAANRLHRYYANFQHTEVKDGGFLCSAFGNGNTPDEAVADYAREISEKRLVLNAYTPDRKEIDAPILTEATK